MGNKFDNFLGHEKNHEGNNYYIVIALTKELENELIDWHFWNFDKDIFKEGFTGMNFNEKTFILMEDKLFNTINNECDLLINMNEEVFAFPEKLEQILKITDQSIKNCDNEEYINLAKEFRKLVVKAIELNTFIGFCF